MDTRLQRILIRQHIPTLRRTSLRMSSRHTVTVAESASDLETIAMAATAGITAVMVDTTAVTVGTMVEIMADTTVAMADITVGTADMVDITDSVEMNRLCSPVGLGKFNLPSLPGKHRRR